jgi:hypothetical protein
LKWLKKALAALVEGPNPPAKKRAPKMPSAKKAAAKQLARKAK